MVGLSSAMTWRKRITPIASASARWQTICRTLHLPSGLKSSSGPAAPVVATASNSAPRRNLSRRSAISLINLIVIRAGHVIAALVAKQFALALGKPPAADRAIQHGLVFLFRSL